MDRIYISTACVKSNKIADSVLTLAKEGFRNIELSGGTEFYENWLSDLLELKEQFELDFICHNYFPPPKDPFVVNLASLNDDIYNQSIKHLIGAVEASKVLGADKFGFHAGFLFNLDLNTIGKTAKDNMETWDSAACFERFVQGFKSIQDVSDIELYVENNVVSHGNMQVMGGNHFMLTNWSGYGELIEAIDFKLLLDVGHLKASCGSLSLNLSEEYAKMIEVSDYVHISDNDGKFDQNRRLKEGSEMHELLKSASTSGKICTIEVYDGIESLHETHDLLIEL